MSKRLSQYQNFKLWYNTRKKLFVVLFAVTLYICHGFSKCCTCGQIDEVLLISFHLCFLMLRCSTVQILSLMKLKELAQNLWDNDIIQPYIYNINLLQELLYCWTNMNRQHIALPQCVIILSKLGTTQTMYSITHYKDNISLLKQKTLWGSNI